MPDPSPGPGELSIDVRAAGVNFPDVLIVQGKYQFKPELPFAPGGEVAGVVRAVGDGVHAFGRGDRVLATTLWGGFAQMAVAKEHHAVRLPEGLDDTTAAAFALAYGTSYYALHDRAGLRAGEPSSFSGPRAASALPPWRSGRPWGQA